MKPSKLTAKLNGRVITIVSLDTALEPGIVLKGTYIHRPRERSFEFIADISGRRMVFDRSDWTIVPIQ